MPRRTFVLIDGENLDATLGQTILKRAPKPTERPRWERVLEFAERLWQQEVVGLFFLNVKDGHLPGPFVSALQGIGFRPVPLTGPATEKIVDIGIQRTLDALVERDADVVLGSGDRDFADHLQRLQQTGHQVAVLAFPELASGVYGELGNRSTTSSTTPAPSTWCCPAPGSSRSTSSTRRRSSSDPEPAVEARMAFFDPAIVQFFTDLTAHDDRAWFDAHRDDYDRLVADPLGRLVSLAEPRYGAGHVTRPNRDLRFTPDRRPYKLTGTMWAHTVGGAYLQVSADGISAGGGLYGPTSEQLQRGRAAIAARPEAARRLHDVIAALDAAGFALAGTPLTAAPRGYPRDHPQIGLLRLKDYAALRHLPISATQADITDAWASVEPLTAWAQQYTAADPPAS